MKRVLILTLCAVMLLSPFSFAQAEGTVTLRFSWWGGDSRAEATLKAIELYDTLNPNVKIEAEYSAFSGYYQKLITQLASGNAPDFFQVDQGWVAELNARGDAFADLNGFDAIDPASIPQTMLDDYCIKDGKLVVLPLGYNGTVILYNKTLLADYLDADGELKDLTWERFEEIGADLHAKDPEAYMTVAVTDGYVRYFLKPILEQITNDISVKDDYTLGFTVEQMTQAFDEFKKVFTSGAAQPYAESVVYDSLQNNALWLNGKIGAVPLFFSNIDGEIANLTDFDWGVTALPKMEGAQTSGQEVCPSLMVAINKNVSETQQAEAAKFIQWMLNDPEAVKLLGTQRGVPASEAALATLVENDMLSDIMTKAIEISSASVGFKNGDYEMDSSINSIFVENMEQVIYDVASSADAAQQLSDALAGRLAEMKQ